MSQIKFSLHKTGKKLFFIQMVVFFTFVSLTFYLIYHGSAAAET